MTVLLTSVVGFLLISLFYIALGNLFLKRLKLNEKYESSVEFSILFYFGIIVWYFFGTALGLAGYFKFQIILGIFAASLILRGKYAFQLLQKLVVDIFSKRSLRAIFPDNRFDQYVFVFVLMFVSLGYFSIIAPIEGDGAAFYMPISKMFAETGYLQKLPGYEGFSAVGLLSEIQLSTLLLFGFEHSARGLAWFVFLPLISIILKFGKSLGVSKSGNLISLFGIFTSTAVFYILYGGKIDIFSAALGFTGLYLLFFTNYNFLAGIYLAAACVAKLSLLIPFFPIITFTLLFKWYRADEKKKIFNCFLMFFLVGFAFLIVVIPHFIKNHFFFNNPLAPFYGTQLSWETEWFSPETTRRILLTYPLIWFFGDYWAQLGRMSLILFMFSPFALFAFLNKSKKLSNSEVLVYISFILAMLFWAVLRPSFVAPRYIMAVLLLLGPIAGRGFDIVLSSYKLPTYFKKYLLIVFCLWSIHSLIQNRGIGFDPLRLVRLTNATDCKYERGSHCVVIEYLNKKVPEGSRVLQLNYFTYWLRSDLLQTMMRSDEFNGLDTMNDKEFWTRVYSRGFRYILLDKATHQSSPFAKYISTDYEYISLIELYSVENIIAYEVNFKFPDVIKPTVSVNKESNLWKVVELSGTNGK